MKIKIGIEKECLVFDKQMNPVTIDIDNLPQELTVDFANHQLEVVGNVFPDAYCTNRDLNKLLHHPYLNDKQVWPLSTPLADNPNVKYNLVDESYRNYLCSKYGITKMLYSGIHFNYSNDLLNSEEDYFQLMKKVYVFMPLIIQFTSFTPYDHHQLPGLKAIGKNYGLDNSISLRASNQYGYTNKFPLNLDYSSLEAFKASQEQLIASKQIRDSREIYTKVRLKTKPSNYIELRFIDLNPFYYAGISSSQLVFLEECLGWLSTYQLSEEFDKQHIQANVEKVTLEGRNRQHIYTIDGKTATLAEHTKWLFEQLKQTVANPINNSKLDQLAKDYQKDSLDLDIMLQIINQQNLSLQQFGIQNMHSPFTYEDIKPQLDMELSTKLVIDCAEKRGYKVDILSKSHNIIRVANQRKSEIIIEASRTNADSYANSLLINHKHLTKKILMENNISVPQGELLNLNQQPSLEFNGKVVVKPLDTNFGLGISIVDFANKHDLNTGISNARKFSDQVIIEQYLPGDEYRFLVIGDQTISVLTRKNANVIGDGTSSISQLIEEKNNSSMRGTNYRRPLEKIIIDDDLIRVLQKSGLALDEIPLCGEQVILRETSNISQGGDSYEVSRIIDNKYKLVALEAARKLGVKICGVDMIIDEDGNYGIIEVNFNPAIHMHMFPYVGPQVDAASAILDLLFD